MSINGEMNKDEWYIYIYIYIHTHTHTLLFNHKKNKITLSAVTQMDLEIVILSGVNQKDKYHISHM